MLNHLKTLGTIIGGILAFIILCGAMVACLGAKGDFYAVCLIIFILFLFVIAYIDIYKYFKKKKG